MAEPAMLTTVDNPYNPFVQFDLWQAFDHQKGYCTMEYLARIAKTSDDLSDADYDAAVNDAIDEILFFDVLGIYQKITESSFDALKSKALSDEQEAALSMLNDEQEVSNETNSISQDTEN